MFEGNVIRELNIEECEFVSGGSDPSDKGKPPVKDSKTDDDGGEPANSNGEGSGGGEDRSGWKFVNTFVDKNDGLLHIVWIDSNAFSLTDSGVRTEVWYGM